MRAQKQIINVKDTKRLYLYRFIPDYSNRFANLSYDNCNDNLDMILHYQYHY